MVEIENEYLKVRVDLHGGTLSSVFDKRAKKELLWQGAENSWKSRDVVIFPINARFKNGEFSHLGKTYAMKNHGLVRYDDLTLESQSQDSATLVYRSSENTLSRYPFEFSLKIAYALCANSLEISARLENIGKRTMYFGFGFHPAYAVGCDEKAEVDDMSGNVIKFGKNGTTERYVLNADGTLIVARKEYEVRDIPLSKEFFGKVKTLIMETISPDVTLKKRDGSSIVFDLKGAPYTAIWTHEKHGGFVCIEPWWGLPDFEDCPKEISEKYGMNALEVGKTFECGYKVIYDNGGK